MIILGPIHENEHSTHSDSHKVKWRHVFSPLEIQSYVALLPRKIDRIAVGRKILKGWRDSVVRPLPYEHARCTQRVLVGDALENTLSYTNGLYDEHNRKQVYNQAYEKFVAQLRHTASLGVAAAEYGQTVKLLSRYFDNLSAVFQMLRGRASTDDVLEVIRMLRKNPSLRAKTIVRRKRAKPVEGLVKNSDKWMADRYLEVQFGILPLIQDVYDVLDVIENPMSPPKVFGRAKGTVPLVKHSPLVGWHYDGWVQIGFHITADVEIESPVFHKMEQFGVLNPASVLWETIPFSFVVDWFGNVGNYIRSWSDFAGLSLTNMSVSERRRSKLALFVNEGEPWGVTRSYELSGIRLTRTVGAIAGPRLEFTGVRLSTSQALSSLALLLQRTKIGR